uniref:Uncharacterized protein n=1 Tax=Arundo donax TaxID=35708 RepID=A0A0A8Z0G7_ARUDO
MLIVFIFVFDFFVFISDTSDAVIVTGNMPVSIGN